MTGFDDEPPGLRRRDVVLVAGPPLAGCGAVLARLCERLPGTSFARAADLAADEAPVAVVFVVSAVAPVTDSDCALARALTRHTAAAVGVVSKIDDHRRWAAVLQANRAALGGDVVWVGAAAAPRVGAPQVDDMVDRVSEVLADPAVTTRNRLRAWRTRLAEELAREDDAVTQRRADMAAAQRRYEALVREQRHGRAERLIGRREAVSRARLELTAAARSRCGSLRAALTAAAAEADRRGVDVLVRRVHDDCAEVLAEIDDLIGAELSTLPGRAGDPGPAEMPELPAPLLRSRRLETRLMTVLGAGFGLGVMLALTRLLTGVAPHETAAAMLAGVVAGAAVTVWVVRARGLLHDRAVLDRWIQQAVHTLRCAAEERVADRMLTAEAAAASATAVEDAAAAARLGEVEAELRDQRRRAERADAEFVRARAALHQRQVALAQRAEAVL